MGLDLITCPQIIVSKVVYSLERVVGVQSLILAVQAGLEEADPGAELDLFIMWIPFSKTDSGVKKMSFLCTHFNNLEGGQRTNEAS